MFALRLLAACVLGAGMSCGAAEAFSCTSDAECGAGRCEVDGLCSVLDSDCAGGHRYGGHAGGLSGQCVPVDGATGAGDGPTSTGVGPPSTDEDTTAEATAASDSGRDLDSDSDADSGSDSADEAGTASDSSGSGGPATSPYGPCDGITDCPVSMSLCSAIGVEGAAPQCLPPCAGDADCPNPRGSDAVPGCIKNRCILDCTNGECPDFMQCDALFGWCVIAQ